MLIEPSDPFTFSGPSVLLYEDIIAFYGLWYGLDLWKEAV